MYFGVIFTLSENLLPRWVAASFTYLSYISKNIINNLLNLLRIWIELKEESILVSRKQLDTIQLDIPGGAFPHTTFHLSVFSLTWLELCHSCDVPCVTVPWYPIIGFPSHAWSLSPCDNAPMTSRSSGRQTAPSLWWARVKTDIQSPVINVCTSPHSYKFSFLTN